MSYILHPENLALIPLLSKRIRCNLERRFELLLQETAGKIDPNLSIVIRTKNDMDYLPTLLDDIMAQEYDGEIEIILVDTESDDGTAEYAKGRGCKVLTISQAEFTYPKALNLGYNAAQYPYVLSIVGHTWLVSRLMFKTITRWHDQPDFGGVHGAPLLHQNASRNERAWAIAWTEKFTAAPWIEHKPRMGVLGANASFVSRQVWQELGGYDEAYAAGGEDYALGCQMLKHGKLIMYDPACMVYHTHGLKLVDNLRQSKHFWEIIAGPGEFQYKKYLSRRPDMRRKDRG